jgi:hypothetical protein
MLDGAFLTHRGFQTKRTHTKTRRKQIAENSGRFNVSLLAAHAMTLAHERFLKLKTN